MIPVDFDIRYTEAADLEHLSGWFTSDPSYFDAFPFDEQEMQDALKNWIGFAKFQASLTGMIEDAPCAIGTLFLMPYKKVAHHASFYLLVKASHRRKGIGTSMVKNLLHLAKSRFSLESVHVEIYDGSSLLPILVKEGFQEFAKQERYVKLSPNRYLSRYLLEKIL